MSQGLTRQIAEFAAAASRQPLDADVIDIVKTGFVDTAGVVLAGKNEAVVANLLRFIARHGACPADASLLFGSARTSTRDAALVNATSGHALDYDDVAFCGHPSVVLVPALLAEGERLGASGMALIKAYVVGYETWAELFYREKEVYHLKGWHPTGVLGGVACAAAVASLRGLDVTRTVFALGIAASMAAGLVANFGTQAKSLHAGHASATGIDAVDYAACGLQTAQDVLEHPSGLLAALTPSGQVDLSPSQTLGRTLRIKQMRLTIKNYPMCFATHRIIDGVVALAEQYDIDPSEVARVDAHLGEAQISMLRNHQPTTGVEAKFSLEFAVAAALLQRTIGLAEVADAFVRSRGVTDLMPLVRAIPRSGMRADQPSLAISDRVSIILKNGQVLEGEEVEFALGDAFNPMTLADQRRKFHDCVSSANQGPRPALFDALTHLEELDDVRTLRNTDAVQSGKKESLMV
jgi:2-methylcitrate dehydratase PrpD